MDRSEQRMREVGEHISGSSCLGQTLTHTRSAMFWFKYPVRFQMGWWSTCTGTTAVSIRRCGCPSQWGSLFGTGCAGSGARPPISASLRLTAQPKLHILCRCSCVQTLYETGCTLHGQLREALDGLSGHRFTFIFINSFSISSNPYTISIFCWSHHTLLHLADQLLDQEIRHKRLVRKADASHRRCIMSF